MRIRIDAEGAKRGTATYHIGPLVPRSRRTKNGHAPKRARERVVALEPRIKRMARRVLGTWFLSTETWEMGIFLYVKTGTSTAKWFELRSLLGWIELCDMEEE